MTDILQRLVGNRLTADEKQGYSEKGKVLATDPEPVEPRKISFALTKEQRLAIYQDVKNRVVDGMTPDGIGKAVLACIEEHLKEKEGEAYGDSGSAVGKGFRRV